MINHKKHQEGQIVQNHKKSINSGKMLIISVKGFVDSRHTLPDLRHMLEIFNPIGLCKKFIRFNVPESVHITFVLDVNFPRNWSMYQKKGIGLFM